MIMTLQYRKKLPATKKLLSLLCTLVLLAGMLPAALADYTSIDLTGYAAFMSCYNLTEIEVPASAAYIGEDVFRMCNNLTVSVIQDSYAAHYCEENGINYITRIE